MRGSDHSRIGPKLDSERALFPSILHHYETLFGCRKNNNERHFVDEINRYKIFMRPLVNLFRGAFQDVGSRLAQVAKVLETIDYQIKPMRQAVGTI